jgi:threonine/homoserine/homoserine lactone efflux protein
MTIIPFGFISGAATSVGLLPHILALVTILFIGRSSEHIWFLIVSTIGAKFLVEWMFWRRFFSSRMDSVKNLKNWRERINSALFTNPLVIFSLFVILIDFGADVMLVKQSLKTSLPPIWIFLAFVSCQAIASPILGLISDYYCRKNSMLFSIAITGLILLASMEINKAITNAFHPSLFGLDRFTTSTCMLIILCAKGLLTSTIVNAKAMIADCIRIEKDARIRV